MLLRVKNNCLNLCSKSFSLTFGSIRQEARSGLAQNSLQSMFRYRKMADKLIKSASFVFTYDFRDNMTSGRGHPVFQQL